MQIFLKKKGLKDQKDQMIDIHICGVDTKKIKSLVSTTAIHPTKTT